MANFIHAMVPALEFAVVIVFIILFIVGLVIAVFIAVDLIFGSLSKRIFVRRKNEMLNLEESNLLKYKNDKREELALSSMSDENGFRGFDNEEK